MPRTAKPMPDDLLTREDVAVLLDVQTQSISVYLNRSRNGSGAHFPEPDRHIGRTPVWRRDTIEAFILARPTVTGEHGGATARVTTLPRRRRSS
jgi:hypothetical protein